MVYIRVRREEVPTRRDKNAGHEHGGNAVPLDGLAQNGGQAGVGCVRAKNPLAGVDGKVSGFMGGELENDDGKAQLEDDLQCDQRAECVVVALLSWGKFARDQGDRDQARDARPTTGEDCIGDGPVKPDGMRDAPQWTVTPSGRRWLGVAAVARDEQGRRCLSGRG